MGDLQSHYYKHSKNSISFIKKYNQELEHPLSLLMVNSFDLEFLLSYESWIRRISVFTEDHHLYYQLVAQAMGRDFYNRFNFHINVGNTINICNETIAWPFDIVNITLNEKMWLTGFMKLENWKKMLSVQYQVAEKFLFVIQGEEPYVSYFNKEIGIDVISNKFKTSLVHKTRFQSEEKTILNNIWDVQRKDEVPQGRQFSEDEQLTISEIMQWGEES